MFFNKGWVGREEKSPSAGELAAFPSGGDLLEGLIWAWVKGEPAENTEYRDDPARKAMAASVKRLLRDGGLELGISSVVPKPATRQPRIRADSCGGEAAEPR